MTYKIASQKEQRRLRRNIVTEVGDVVETLSPIERRDVLLKLIDSLNEEIKNWTPRFHKSKAQIGHQIQEAMKEISQIKKDNRLDFNSTSEFDRQLLSIIRQEVTVAQWKIWLEKTKLAVKPQPPDSEKLIEGGGR